MKKSRKVKKGVSLIILVITIIVIIILVAAVIFALNSNNPITNAKKATTQSDLKTLANELNLYLSNSYTDELGTIDLTTIDAKGDEMRKYMPSIKDKYCDILEIVDGKLLVAEDAMGEESEWAKELFEVATTPAFGNNENTTPGVAKVNSPVLAKGLKAIMFDSNGISSQVVETDSQWYAYVDQGVYKTDGKTSRWANAESVDGSQWVWIPRYAYKIPSGTGKDAASEVQVVFLKGSGDTYYDTESRKYKSAKRIGEVGAGTSDYMVHPVFTDEKSTNFSNGGWDSELTGIWVAKYEGGFANQNGVPAHAKGKQSVTIAYGGVNTTISYPVFKPNAFSYADKSVGDLYALSKNLNSENNPYGFEADSDIHLIKNSEWGAVSYLAQSRYGRNGNELRKNNVKESNKVITGAGALEEGFSLNDSRYNGQYGKLASTTGNIYGIYDINGGYWEYMAGYLMNNSKKLETNGKKMVDNQNDNPEEQYADNIATKHISVYKTGTTDTALNNYKQSDNKLRKGEAIWETSSTGNSSSSSWFEEHANFPALSNAFISRGSLLAYGSYDGVAYAVMSNLGSFYVGGFRTVLTNSSM